MRTFSGDIEIGRARQPSYANTWAVNSRLLPLIPTRPPPLRRMGSEYQLALCALRVPGVVLSWLSCASFQTSGSETRGVDHGGWRGPDPGKYV